MKSYPVYLTVSLNVGTQAFLAADVVEQDAGTRDVVASSGDVEHRYAGADFSVAFVQTESGRTFGKMYGLDCGPPAFDPTVPAR